MQFAVKSQRNEATAAPSKEIVDAFSIAAIGIRFSGSLLHPVVDFLDSPEVPVAAFDRLIPRRVDIIAIAFGEEGLKAVTHGAEILPAGHQDESS